MGILYGEFDEDRQELTTYKDGQRLCTVRIDDASPAQHDKACSVMTESINGEKGSACTSLTGGAVDRRAIVLDRHGSSPSTSSATTRDHAPSRVAP